MTFRQDSKLKNTKTSINPPTDIVEEVDTQSSGSSVHKDGQDWNPYPKASKYLMRPDAKKMIEKLDETIARKKEEDPIGYRYLMERKAVMNALKPRKGHGVTIPCHLKMKAFKFLCKCFEIGDYEELDFDADHFKRGCTHAYKEEKMEEFEK